MIRLRDIVDSIDARLPSNAYCKIWGKQITGQAKYICKIITRNGIGNFSAARVFHGKHHERLVADHFLWLYLNKKGKRK